MLNDIYCLIIKVANMIIAVVFSWWIDMLIFILSFLPVSPFKFEPIKWGEFGNAIGYFIPVGRMAEHFAMILVAVTMWYALQHILRILRMVR